ncbi:winged helix-turn-helix transcriptional regulator [Amycolatopsis sp. CA-161197]|uniref:winged helix-turn-helix transcriptional regulator n=1 Tax=Amycolatopsis sp. CA-161197 TaxID=3239922 RepID=UPI003D93A6EE
MTADDECRTREVLDIVVDKLSRLVVRHLRDRPLRFTELERAVGRISRRMLTVTLRTMERDGIMAHRHAAAPQLRAHRDGQTLRTAVLPLLEFNTTNLPHIDLARTKHDTQ